MIVKLLLVVVEIGMNAGTIIGLSGALAVLCACLNQGVMKR